MKAAIKEAVQENKGNQKMNLALRGVQLHVAGSIWRNVDMMDLKPGDIFRTNNGYCTDYGDPMVAESEPFKIDGPAYAGIKSRPVSI